MDKSIYSNENFDKLYVANGAPVNRPFIKTRETGWRKFSSHERVQLIFKAEGATKEEALFSVDYIAQECLDGNWVRKATPIPLMEIINYSFPDYKYLVEFIGKRALDLTPIITILYLQPSVDQVEEFKKQHPDRIIVKDSIWTKRK